MGSWTEKFKDGVELEVFGLKMCKFLGELKPFITDEKLLKKLKRMQLKFLENPDELKYYSK